MNVKLLGKENVDYVSKKTNNPVIGTALYVEFPVKTNPKLIGNKAENVFTKLPCHEFNPGDILSLTYETMPGSKYSELVNIDKVKA